MLPLDSPRWSELKHAYGKASDIPELIEQLEAVAQGVLTLPAPQYEYETEPWFSLWSALCHQGDVYTASYAAIPHIVRIAARAEQGLWEYFAFIASIEVSRATSGPDIPKDLIISYTSALDQVPELIHTLTDRKWDELLSRSIAAALVVCKGHTQLGRAIMELSPDEASRFLQQAGIEAEDAEEGDC